MLQVSGASSTAVEPRNDDDDDVIHMVGVLEGIIADTRRLKTPRALCGVLLLGDPDRPDPMDLGAPPCPRCRDIARRRYGDAPDSTGR